MAIMLPQDVEKLKAEFGDREFTGKDVARVLEMKTWHGSGAMLKGLRRSKQVYATLNGYRFGTPSQLSPVEAPVKAEITPITNELISTPPLTRIGDYLMFHERVILIADTARQDGSDAIRLTTSILEYDTTFRAVRNKVINFVKSRDPKEYATMRAWLESMAGTVPHVVDDTALELAAELEGKLNAANHEIAELKAKLDAIRGAL